MPEPSRPKPCPFCGQGPFAETYNEWFAETYNEWSMGVVYRVTWVQCATEDCPLHKLDWIRAEQWNSRPIEHMLHERINDLESRITLAIDLSISYDGFNDAEGLKSLIDDMVLALKGELKTMSEEEFRDGQ